MVSINITPFIQNFESILLTQIEIVVYGIHYRIEKGIPLSRVYRMKILIFYLVAPLL